MPSDILKIHIQVEFSLRWTAENENVMGKKWCHCGFRGWQLLMRGEGAVEGKEAEEMVGEQTGGKLFITGNGQWVFKAVSLIFSFKVLYCLYVILYCIVISVHNPPKYSKSMQRRIWSMLLWNEEIGTVSSQEWWCEIL